MSEPFATPVVPERIETPRLILRKPMLEDAEEVFEAYASDPEVTRYLTWLTHTSRVWALKK